ncbi:MAG: RsmE family RNA methyltransferase [Pirellulales bacterium]
MPPPVTLAVALPKGDRQKWLIEKCVELGVARFVPLATARGVAQPVEGAPRPLAAASHRSGQTVRRPPLHGDRRPTNNRGGRRRVRIAHAVDLRRATAGCAETLALLAETSAAQELRCDAKTWLHATGERICLIGPEGGFTLEELRTATAAGARLLDLGRNVLRVETAALVAAAWALAGPHSK